MAALPQFRSPTIDAIEAAVLVRAERHDDAVVRGSAIGRACERHLWYRFRWVHEPEAFEPRMLRLFETGHVEEARMVGWLRMAGLDVADVDPASGEQWEVVALAGHFKGHLDGIVTGVIEAPVARHLLECKTHNAKSFAQLVKHGVSVLKPEHVAQMQAYMHLQGLSRAFYLAKNKDTDELYAERLEYDPAAGLSLLAKAERIVEAKGPLTRISDDPEFFVCRFCHSADVCHRGAWARRNCRTCLHATPEPDGDGRWSCARHRTDLTFEAQQAGCPHHLFIPGLVPGEQIDADEIAETITYLMPDGAMWRDGYVDSRRAA